MHQLDQDEIKSVTQFEAFGSMNQCSLLLQHNSDYELCLKR